MGPVVDLLQVPGEVVSRQACFLEPEDRAIVLGSTEPVADLDLDACSKAGVGVLRRSSGGGSVLVGPGEQLWLDLFIPTGDVLSETDVGAAARFAGELWHEALSLLVPPESKMSVYTGPLLKSRYSSKVCFSGLGPGELLINGRKAVGLSQRRNREGAWFFTMALLALDSGLQSSLLSFEEESERDALAASLDASVSVLVVSPTAVKEALINCLS